MSSLASIFFLALIPWQTSAQESWSLARILNKATGDSYVMQASDQDVLRASNQAKQDGRWDNPEISVSAGPYTDNSVKGTAQSASITQSVPLFGQKSIAAKIGRQEQLIAESDRDMNKLLIQHEVVRLTFRLAAVSEQEKHISHRRERIGLIAKYLETRPFASPSMAVEKNLIENRIREIEEQFAKISAEKDKAWQALNVYLGLNKPVVADVTWYLKPELLNHEDLLSSCSQSNPELVRQSRLISSAQLQVEQAGKRAYPDVRLGVGYYNQAVGQDKQNSYSGIVELSLPIWNRGNYAASAARARKNSEELKLEHKKRETTAAFESAWAELIESRKRIELFPGKLVPTLEDGMRAAEKNWRKGLVTVPAFLELESQVHDQAVRVYDAQTSYVQALSQVLLLAGRQFQVEGK